MRIEVVLNPGAADLAEVRTQLAAELTALQQKGIVVSQRTEEVETGALGLHEVYQFIIDFTQAATPPLLFAKIVAELTNAVLRRRQGEASSARTTADKTPPPSAISITINQRSIQLPATDAQLQRFLSKLGVDDSVRSASPKRAQSGGDRRVPGKRARKGK